MTRWNCRRPLGPREGHQDHPLESLLLYLHRTNPFIMAFALTVDKGHSLTLSKHHHQTTSLSFPEKT